MRAKTDQRRFIRLPFGREATLEGPDGSVQGRVQDISLNGVRLKLDGEPPGPEHARYWMTVALAPGCTVRMQLRLVHAHGHTTGFQCRRMDSESLANLKRLVALYYGPSNGMNAELDRLQAMIRHRPPEPPHGIEPRAASSEARA